MGPIQVLISYVLNKNISRLQMSYQEMESDIGCMYLSGRLDVRTVPEIEKKFKSTIISQRKSMVVDLSGVDLMNSVGLGLLISAANALRLRGKQVVLLNPRPGVEKVVAMACVEQLLPIEHSLAGALNRIQSNSYSAWELETLPSAK